MKPNQEPVERWQDTFDEKWHSDKDEGGWCIKGTPSREYKPIKEFVAHQKALSRAEVLEEVEKTIRSFIAVNQQNRAYNEKQEPYTDRIELLDTVIKSLEEKKL